MRVRRDSGDAEVEAFVAVGDRLAGFDARLDPEYIDGWLAALACAPVRLPADEWLPMLADDAFDRSFADPPDRAAAMHALGGRFAVLANQLDAEALEAAPDQLRLAPLMWARDGEPLGAAWAEGFLAGFAACTERWPTELPARDAAYLGGLLAIVGALREARAEAGDDEAVDAAAFAAQDLRLWWLDHGPRPAPRRVDKAPGRNDPCPCGSGRKYKHCHSAVQA